MTGGSIAAFGLGLFLVLIGSMLYMDEWKYSKYLIAVGIVHLLPAIFLMWTNILFG